MIGTTNIILPASRTENIEYAIRDISVFAKQVEEQGQEMLYLNIGDPMAYDFRTPPHIIEAIHQGMLAGDTGYAPAEGLEKAIRSIEKEERQKGIDHIAQICVTTGASEAAVKNNVFRAVRKLRAALGPLLGGAR